MRAQVGQRYQVAWAELGDVAAAEQAQNPVDFNTEDFECARGSGFTRSRDAEQRCTSDQNAFGTERQSLDDIGASPEAAIDHYDGIAGGVDDLGQRLDGR